MLKENIEKDMKSRRILIIFSKLSNGEKVNKKSLCLLFNVSSKTIQRDIDDIRSYISNENYGDYEEIKYDKKEKKYYLISKKEEQLEKEEILVLIKVLLESRALNKKELDKIINKLMDTLKIKIDTNESNVIKNIIKNEQLYYKPLLHGKNLLNLLWEFSCLIYKKNVVKIKYINLLKYEKIIKIEPVAIMFSEYYFYLIAYKQNEGYEFPTVFRLDRILEYQKQNVFFNVPYSNSFNYGEFRDRVQFMYSGKLEKVEFYYCGPSIEAVLDRLPTAKAKLIDEVKGIYFVKAEAYGKGIYMWLGSQGNNVYYKYKGYVN